MIKVNKPLVILGIILLGLGGIGAYYIIELFAVVVIGITLVIVGITVGSGRFSKHSVVDDSGVEFCPNCGSTIAKGSKFCGYCSEKL